MEEVTKDWCIMAAEVGKMFVRFVKLMVKSEDVKELKLWATSSISELCWLALFENFVYFELYFVFN